MSPNLDSNRPPLLKTLYPVGAEAKRDRGLGRMIAVSAVLHGLVIGLIVLMIVRSQLGPRRSVAYTVELVDPAALGTSTRSAPMPKSAQAVSPPPLAKLSPKSPPEPKATKPPARPIEKPQTTKVSKPPSPPKKDVVTLPDKTKQKKPPEKKTAVKPKTPPKKKTTPQKQPKKKEQPAQAKAPPKKETPAKPAAKTPSPKERDQQILAAIDRIRQKVQEPDPSSGGIGGSGPPSLGDSSSQGGGGVVRGLAFLMYTEQIKQRVKESWIVTERQAGFVAKVRFGVQPDGKVFDVELTQRSGNSPFDESVLRAVRRVDPLPPPPHEYQQVFATEKVEITFGGEEQVH